VIRLDTDVLSALMRSEPEAIVVDWLDAQPPESIWTTSVTVFEIRAGLELIPFSACGSSIPGVPHATPTGVPLILKQAIPEVRGRFTGRDRLDEPSQQLSGR